MQTCDECGPAVTARELVSLPNGGMLTYCGHHANMYRQTLTDRGAYLYTIGEVGTVVHDCTVEAAGYCDECGAIE